MLAHIITILFFATIIWLAYDIIIRRNPYNITPIEGFENTYQRAGIPDDIFAKQVSPALIDEMIQQLNNLDSADRHLARDQLNHYIPHPEIVRKYRETTESMLESLKKQVDAHSQDKRKQLDRLNSYLLNLQEYVDADFVDRQRRQRYTAIKSHNNGQELALIPVLDPNTNYVRSGLYRIQTNGGCVQVPQNNDYSITPLDTSNEDQIFRLVMIYNETSYRNAMASGFPQISNLGNVRYPFAIMRATSNGNCLRNHHGRLSVEPCREHEGQRWGVLEESQLPKCM